MQAGKPYKVRYLLVDAPELADKQLYAEEARAFTEGMLKSGNVEIEFGPGDKMDKYQRILAYVYVDGKSVQEEMLRKGYARTAYLFPPNTTYLEEFKRAENEAKAAEIGVWSIPGYATESNGFDMSVVGDGINIDTGAIWNDIKTIGASVLESFESNE